MGKIVPFYENEEKELALNAYALLSMNLSRDDVLDFIIDLVDNRSEEEQMKIICFLAKVIKTPVYLTIADVCNVTGMSRTTVQYLFNREDFPCVDIGKSKVVESKDLTEYLKAHKSETKKRKKHYIA